MKKAILGSLYFLPLLASAATFTNVTALAGEFYVLISTIMPIVFAIAVIYFFWGVAKYILAAGDPKAASEGKSIMIYGVIAIAVMATLFGLITFLQETFGLDAGGTIDLPDLPQD